MKSALATVMTLALAACTSTPTRPLARVECHRPPFSTNVVGPALIDTSDRVAPIAADAALFLDRHLERQIAVQNVSATRLRAGAVRVTARLANCTAGDHAVRLRTSFLDAALRPAEATSAWQTVFVPRHGLALYDETSLGSGGATHYLIEIAAND